MPLSDDTVKSGLKRLTQVFRYLEALNHHRNPATRHIDDQLWRLWFRDLPDHPCIRLTKIGETGGADESSTKAAPDPLLHVRRPKLTPCPDPAGKLLPWLERGWQEITSEVRVRPSQNELDKDGRTIIVRFEDDRSRPAALEKWRTQRESWIASERPARDAMRVFEQLYEIRGRIEREGEKVELVLGEGILSWKRPDGGVYHPVLLQRVQLEFNPSVPEFTIIETERPAEFYSALFQSMPDVEGKVLARVRQELEEGRFHPLGDENTSGLLRSLVVQLSPRGEFHAQSAPKAQDENPLIGRSPVILLRRRTLGFAVAFQSVLEDLSASGKANVPTSLFRIVGIEDALPTDAAAEAVGCSISEPHPDEVLLSKPANPEQVRIAQRLEQHGSVLVQGPPGTGKTHTIANLVGHLLAQGKSILVTSHTSKALRVVRDQVVPQLRPLCVSVLDSDFDSRKQLESSINEIVSRLSRSDGHQLDTLAAELQTKRDALLAAQRSLKEAILNARTDEYREIVIGGEAFSPSEAARKVRAGRGELDYIPAAVEAGHALPLSETELSELYAINESVSLADEAELRGVLPNPTELPLPAQFEGLVQERNELSKQNLTSQAGLWERPPLREHASSLEALSYKVQQAARMINESERWQLSAMLSGYHGGNHRKSWESLVTQIKETWNAAAEIRDLLIQYSPQLPQDFSAEQARSISKEICTHLERNSSLSFLVLLTRTAWKRFIRGSRVSGTEPSRAEHFAALHGLAEIAIRRTQLLMRWNNQMVPLGAIGTDALGTAPEEMLWQFCDPIKRCLNWHDSEWMPIEAEMVQIGLRFKQLLEEQPSDLSGGELRRLAKVLDGPLQQALAARRNVIRWNVVEEELANISAVLESAGGDSQSTIVVEKLREAVRRRDPNLYRTAIDRLNALFQRRKDLERRRELLRKLEGAAPGWAEAIRKRLSIHGQAVAPARVREAWLWRQLNEGLDRRGSVSLEDLLARSERTEREIRAVTAELIERKAWSAQLRRTENNLPQKQALIGWLDTIKKIGKGTGILVPKENAR